MKKKIIISIIITVSIISIIKPVSLYAAEISAGLTSWYSWWDLSRNDTGRKTTIDPTILYGPALSVKFSDNYNLTFILLYGKFDMNEEYSASDYKNTNKVSRTDSDLALNYRMNNYLKIFAGAKYMSYEVSSEFEHTSIGPGAGVSAVLPVGMDFYLLANVSALYLWGNEDSKSYDDSLNKEVNINSEYKEYGANSSLSLAYYIAPASTTLSLGGRYQYFKTAYDDKINEDMNHHFYGVTFTATYSFSI